MARTKDAVTTFLELGAKYELVLVGLADEVQMQSAKIDQVERNVAETSNSVKQIGKQTKLIQSEASAALRDLKEQHLRNLENQEIFLKFVQRQRRKVQGSFVVGVIALGTAIASLLL